MPGLVYNQYIVLLSQEGYDPQGQATTAEPTEVPCRWVMSRQTLMVRSDDAIPRGSHVWFDPTFGTALPGQTLKRYLSMLAAFGPGQSLGIWVVEKTGQGEDLKGQVQYNRSEAVPFSNSQ